VVELEWEKVAVPFKVSVDVHDLVEASLKKQLRKPIAVHVAELGRCGELPAGGESRPGWRADLCQ